VNAWSAGHFNSFQLIVMAISLMFSFYFQGYWPSGTFPRWDRFAIIVSFPLACVFLVIGQIFVFVGMVAGMLLAQFAATVLGVGIIALVIFVIIGVFGVLLFGFRQVF
jgi:hypothetical protein